MKKYLLIFRLLFANVFLLFILNGWEKKCYAQAFSPTVIASSGTFASSTNGSMAWTIGEVITETYSYEENFFTQGFHQPNKKDIVRVINFFIPEGFSPNGDGINDLFVIRGISNFPENSITIFNRWGNKVFEESSYKNSWDGRSTKGVSIGGDELPISTYFYLLDLGNASEVIKGTIYLNR